MLQRGRVLSLLLIVLVESHSLLAALEQRGRQLGPPPSIVVSDAPPLPQSLRSVIAQSDLIVVGVVSARSPISVPEGGRAPSRTVTLVVSETIKSPLAGVGATVTILEPGGTAETDGRLVTLVTSTSPLQVGTRGMFFLKARSDGRYRLPWGDPSRLLIADSDVDRLSPLLSFPELRSKRKISDVVTATRAAATTVR
jgi:hypothetical protein